MGTSDFDPLTALDAARGRFDGSVDFTIGVEEEFQILDPATLELAPRFVELKALADASPLAENVAGELISCEIEVKTGRCTTFAEAAAKMVDRRRVLLELADELGVGICAAGTHPFSAWQDQSIIDTPHYRLRDELLRYVAWRNNTFGIHVHVGIRGTDRAIAVANALRGVIPELIAVSASSPWLEGRITHLRSTRTQIFTRMFPRCGIPDVFSGWAEYDAFVRFLVATGSITDQTEIWWTVRPHQSFGTIEIRACDALADVGEAIAVCAFQVALAARFARLYDAGEPLPIFAHRDIEENFWRALRFGLDGDLIDLVARRSLPAAEHVRNLLAACGPEIESLGLAPYLGPLEGILADGDNATRLVRRAEAGESLHALLAEQVARTRDSVLARTGAAT